ncbi:50S ribosomal protein L13 [Geodia barretti]|uniref:50S ribosomal protein L13 n=1 Tax=Geodia barretti TaxID=519541 RepID=A0AA35SBJ2_GEOBA|nr:50S ribosomal protein L13 [Geodia barretti]
MKRTSTYFPKPGQVEQKWRLIDATGQSLGRLARDVAVALQGKDRPTYTPHVLTGDHVVVVNMDKVRITGDKLLQKTYYRHSGYVGNLKSFILRDVLESHPDRVLQLAVKGMLPRNKLGREMLKRLKVYAGDSHPHEAQIGQLSEQREGN